MDDVDAATEHVERERQGLLAQRKPTPNRTANGRCWCCDAVLAPGMRWCDAICRDDWEKENP